VKRIRSLSTPTGGTGTITFNATATTDLEIIPTPLLMRTAVKSITVTINAAPEKSLLLYSYSTKCFGEKE
jgi:hypothetical protein